MKKILIAGIVVAALAAGMGFWLWTSKGPARTNFTLREVTRGRLEATVGSTGTLQPREIVDVGAQVLAALAGAVTGAVGAEPKVVGL